MGKQIIHIKAPDEDAREAKEAWGEVQSLGHGQGKEQKKRMILNAWCTKSKNIKLRINARFYKKHKKETTIIIIIIRVCHRIKDKTFGSSFWNVVQGITSKNTRGVELRWKTRKQLEDIFGVQTEDMIEVLPKRLHPANNRIEQWRLSDDYASMEVEKTKSRKVTGSRKLTDGQASGLRDAMDLNITDNTMHEVEKDFEDPAFKKMLEDPEFDADVLPSKGMLRDNKSVVGSKGGKDAPKATLEERMELQERTNNYLNIQSQRP